MAFTRLTVAQATALKADILASSATVTADGQTFPLRDVLAEPGANPVAGSFSLLYDYYRALASPAFYVWRYNVPVDEIFDQINWTNLTPAVPASAANQDTAAVFRSNVCVSKQVNLQLMLQGRATLDATKNSTRAGLQDALTDVPSAANGNARQAGWTSVQTVLARQATRLEKLFANVSGGDGAAVTAAARATLDTLRDGEVPASDFVELRTLP